MSRNVAEVINYSSACTVTNIKNTIIPKMLITSIYRGFARFGAPGNLDNVPLRDGKRLSELLR